MQDKIDQFLLNPENPNLQVTQEEICIAFSQTCDSNSQDIAFSLIHRFPILLDFSTIMDLNPLYWAHCFERLPIFEKLLNNSPKPNPDALSNIFSILQLIIMKDQVDFFKLIYPYWNKQLTPENKKQERKRFVDCIQEYSEESTEIQRLMGYNFREKGCAILLSKNGLFSPNGQETLFPDLAKHIVELAIQSETGFRKI